VNNKWRVSFNIFPSSEAVSPSQSIYSSSV
jgi:hypothetical protein